MDNNGLKAEKCTTSSACGSSIPSFKSKLIEQTDKEASQSCESAKASETYA